MSIISFPFPIYAPNKKELDKFLQILLISYD